MAIGKGPDASKKAGKQASESLEHNVLIRRQFRESLVQFRLRPRNRRDKAWVAEMSRKSKGKREVVPVYTGHTVLRNGDVKIQHTETMLRRVAEANQVVHPLAWILLGRRNKRGEIEFFIQKRSPTKRFNPSKKSVSANGPSRPGESIVTAARRELAEELCAMAGPVKFIGMYENRPKPRDHGGKVLPHVNIFLTMGIHKPDPEKPLKPDEKEMDSKESKWMTIRGIKRSFTRGEFTKPGSHEIMGKLLNGEYGDIVTHFEELERKAKSLIANNLYICTF